MSEPTAADSAQLLPLRPLIFAILLVLKKSDLHGYGIMKWVNENAGLGGMLGPGTLYRTLKEMRDLDLVAHTEPPETITEVDERRSYYTLTPFGRHIVAAEAERIRRMMTEAHAVDLIAKAESR
ncbi:MAG: helix-turn-helix transcriptional regulator [Acidobacteriota bacterium]|jgi:DNA-binding PadR family transcriptional regulator